MPVTCQSKTVTPMAEDIAHPLRSRPVQNDEMSAYMSRSTFPVIIFARSLPQTTEIERKCNRRVSVATRTRVGTATHALKCLNELLVHTATLGVRIPSIFIKDGCQTPLLHFAQAPDETSCPMLSQSNRSAISPSARPRAKKSNHEGHRTLPLLQ